MLRLYRDSDGGAAFAKPSLFSTNLALGGVGFYLGVGSSRRSSIDIRVVGRVPRVEPFICTQYRPSGIHTLVQGPGGDSPHNIQMGKPSPSLCGRAGVGLLGGMALNAGRSFGLCVWTESLAGRRRYRGTIGICTEPVREALSVGNEVIGSQSAADDSSFLISATDHARRP